MLARIPELRVAARTSSFQFKGKNEDMREHRPEAQRGDDPRGERAQGGEPRPDHGPAREGADGFHLWSETYDRELDDIFAVQDDIARSVASALKVTLLGKDDALGRRGGQRRGLQPLPAGKVLPRPAEPGGPGEGDRLLRAGAEARPRLCPRLGGPGRRPLRQADRGYIPVDEGYRKARRGGGESARARSEPGRGSRGPGLDPDGLRLGLVGSGRRLQAGPRARARECHGRPGAGRPGRHAGPLRRSDPSGPGARSSSTR